MVAFCAISCKKKEKDPEPATPADTQVYCVYGYVGQNKLFYKCVTGKDAANQAYKEADRGDGALSVAKNSCSECQ